MLNGVRDIGNTRPAAPTMARASSEGGDGIPDLLDEGAEQEVAHRVPGQRIDPGVVAAETILKQLGEAPGDWVARVGQGHERLAQIAGRQTAALGPQASAGAPVVTDRHHRGDVEFDVRLEQPQRTQRRGEPVSAAERDNPDRPVQCRVIRSRVWGPPESLSTQVAMLGIRGEPHIAQPPRQLLRDGDTAVLPPCSRPRP